MVHAVNPAIFRAYDIRGLEGKDLTPELAELLGKSFGTHIQRAQAGKQRVAIGRDNRLGSKLLAEAYIRGLLATGCDVVDLGLAISPAVYFAVNHWKLKGGVIVTGSHNPKGYNGFKMVRQGPVPVADDEIQALKKLVIERDFVSGLGGHHTREIQADYFNFLRSEVHLQRPLKVVVDAGNGTAGIFAPSLLRELGCEVVELYCDLDGTFPNHMPDPEMHENMVDLSKEVVKTNADLGLAYDGDGDRVGFVDENGRQYHADLLLMLLARYFLQKQPGQRILLDVKCSDSVLEDIEAHGGVPFLWRTGHSFIKKKMREDDIVLGGEISGHMFFRKLRGFDDALLASAYLLESLSKQKHPLSENFTDFKFLPSTPELKVLCSDEEKFSVVQRISQHFTSLCPNSLTIDGIRIKFSDGWALVRASNTNPYLTIRIEGRTTAALERIRNIVASKLSEFPEVTVPDALRSGAGDA